MPIDDSIDATTAVHDLAFDGEPELLLERATDRTTNRVRLPAAGIDDLGDGGAVLPSQEFDEQGLLRPRPDTCWQ